MKLQILCQKHMLGNPWKRVPKTVSLALSPTNQQVFYFILFYFYSYSYLGIYYFID